MATKSISDICGSPAILGLLPFRSVTLRPLLSQSLPFLCYDNHKALFVPINFVNFFGYLKSIFNYMIIKINIRFIEAGRKDSAADLCWGYGMSSESL
jgi:hypothetical protein